MGDVGCSWSKRGPLLSTDRHPEYDAGAGPYDEQWSPIRLYSRVTTPGAATALGIIPASSSVVLKFA